MIPFDFEYYRPDTLGEARKTYICAEERGMAPVYYGGGSELISMARAGSVTFGAVIDIKNIPELRVNSLADNELVLGAALTLNELAETDNFPLLGKCAGRVADHTMQCRITLGGNLKSTIIYRETALAFLLANAKITSLGPIGLREYDFDKVFKKSLILPGNELIISVSIRREFLDAPYFHIKKTKNEKIDYPLVTVAAMIIKGKLRVALSGLAPYPVRNKRAETLLNDRSKSREERVCGACGILSAVSFGDINGCAEYREFVLKNTLTKMLEELEV